ncbi:MAG: hypothetical protein GYA51_14265 [Candidatus Methanofastidiosa archaeon]|jgi:uncharacterized membrane protein|nr:hypothetical protein [Candidatus Methanofastidiosa archaeon]
MIKRVVGIFALCLGFALGSYYTVYFSFFGNESMLLLLSLIVIALFVLGVFVLKLDSKERKLKKEKKIVLEMIKKARIAQERQVYTGVFDDLRKRRMY